jgi:hypothetical protein
MTLQKITFLCLAQLYQVEESYECLRKKGTLLLRAGPGDVHGVHQEVGEGGDPGEDWLRLQGVTTFNH